MRSLARVARSRRFVRSGVLPRSPATAPLLHGKPVALGSAGEGRFDGRGLRRFSDGHADRSRDEGRQAGLLGVVISASAAQLASERMPLADAVHRQLCGLLPGLPAPAWSKVITEKQATFSCTPGLERPATVTAEPGIVLAGDHVASDYPATLEGAVRSGLQAADAVVARMRRG